MPVPLAPRISILYRRPAIAFDHYIELEHRCLCGSSKQSHVWRLRRGFSTRCPASPCRLSTARRPHRAGPTDGSALFRSHPAHGRMPAHLSKCLLQTCIGERCPDTNVMSRRWGRELPHPTPRHDIQPTGITKPLAKAGNVMLRRAVIFAKVAIENLGRWMGIDIQKARHKAKPCSVDGSIRVTPLFAPN